MTTIRPIPSLRSLVLPLALAATPLSALAWPTLTIPTTALQADAVQAFSGDALGAFELAEITIKPVGQASVTSGLAGAFTLPVTSITIDGLKVVGGKATGAGLRFERYNWENDSTQVVTLANFRIDFNTHVIHADAFPQGGTPKSDAPIFQFREQTALAIKYQFPLSISAHQTLDRLFLTPAARTIFTDGLQLDPVMSAPLEIIDFGEIRIAVDVKLRKKPVSSKPYRP